MLTENQKYNLLSIVTEMCKTSTPFVDCRGLSLCDLGKKMFDTLNNFDERCPISTDISIQEIPLNWENQVEILFYLDTEYYSAKESESCNSIFTICPYYSLFCGIGTDNEFHCEISITGVSHSQSSEYSFFEGYNESQILCDFTR
jgi:hypothetical protein